MATILVVDDIAINRLLIAAVLAPRGHTVRECDDGDAALREIAVEEPDLIVLDLSMPGTGGAAFLQALRKERRTPVVLYTATRPDGALRDFMKAYDVRAVLEKPAEPDAIIAVLEGALSAEA